MAQPLRHEGFASEPHQVQPAMPYDVAARQAFQILYFGFIVAPIVAGLDKFFHLLVNWTSTWPRSSRDWCRSTRTPSCW
jgi:hypothetical protein